MLYTPLSCQVMRDNRLMREQQYAERREKDWEATMTREAELHRSMKAQVSVWGVAAGETGHA